jgi:hypothetical protein
MCVSRPGVRANGELSFPGKGRYAVSLDTDTGDSRFMTDTPKDLGSVSVLVPGKLHERSVARLGGAFDLVRIDRADPALLDEKLRRSVRGVAAMTTIDAAFIDSLPALEIIASFGVGYDSVDARHAASRGVVVTNTPDVLTE